MLVRALEFKSIIADTVHGFKDDKLIRLCLKDEDWKNVEDLIRILKPLKVTSYP
jgi:hypothetical protein